MGLAGRIFRLGLAGAMIAVVACPASAGAATIFHGVYIAGPGETNHVTLSYNADTATYTYEDPGITSITDTDGLGECVVTGNVARCPSSSVAANAGFVRIDVGDGDDSAVITTQLPRLGFQGPQLVGGPGSDLLNSGPGTAYDGTQRTLIDADLAGDGGLYHPFAPGAGNDTLIGGAGNDGILGDGGNDVELGGGGSDLFDGTPFYYADPRASEAFAAGSDSQDGGPGSDLFNGIEAAGSAAPDESLCGSGDEQPIISGFIPGKDLVPGDEAIAGPGDALTTDCETVVGAIQCPATLPSPCVGNSVVVGSAPAAGASAVASARHGRRKLILGSGKFRAAPGRLIPVRIGLKRKRVNRLVRQRRRAKVNERANARSHGRKLKFKPIRFFLKKS